MIKVNEAGQMSKHFKCKNIHNSSVVTSNLHETTFIDPPFLLAQSDINSNRTNLSQKNGGSKKVVSSTFEKNTDEL